MHPELSLFWKLFQLWQLHKGDKASTPTPALSSLCSQGTRKEQLGCQEGCEAAEAFD